MDGGARGGCADNVYQMRHSAPVTRIPFTGPQTVSSITFPTRCACRAPDSRDVATLAESPGRKLSIDRINSMMKVKEGFHVGLILFRAGWLFWYVKTLLS